MLLPKTYQFPLTRQCLNIIPERVMDTKWQMKRVIPFLDDLDIRFTPQFHLCKPTFCTYIFRFTYCERFFTERIFF